MPGEDTSSLTFGPYRLDLRARVLTRDGNAVPLVGRGFDTLAVLAGAAGATVSKDALLDAVWPGLTVEENNLQVQISALRKLLGEGWIVTVPSRGYRLGSPASAPQAVPTQPNRPSLAVLPFANLSGDPEQDYFADGMAEDIITALSRTGWLFVIARNSSFTYKGKVPDIRVVGQELGVRYVLEGSVRRAGGRVRIACQLIEAATGGHVWADQFDGAFSDIFELQDRVSERVVGAIEPSLRRAEIMRVVHKPTESLDAYDLYLRALHRFELFSDSDTIASGDLLRQAITLDGSFALAKARLAFQSATRFAKGWLQPGHADVDEAITLARAALAEAPDDPGTLRMAGHAISYLTHDHRAAWVALDRAMLLSPNSAPVLFAAAWIANYAGDFERARNLFERGMRISPLDSEMRFHYVGLAHVLLFLGEKEHAVELALRAISGRPGATFGVEIAVMCLVEVGRIEEARALFQRKVEVEPSCSISREIVTTSAFLPAMVERRVAAMRIAGYPE